MNENRNKSMNESSPKSIGKRRGISLMRGNRGFFLLAVSLLCSCTEFTRLELPAPAPAPSEVALGVHSVSLSMVLTRTSTPLTQNGATLGVYRLAAGGYDFQGPVAFEYDAVNGQWDYRAGETPIYLTDAQAQVCALSPYDAAFTDLSALPLQAGEYTQSADLCYSGIVEGVDKDSPGVDFADLSRAYSQITFSLLKDPSYPGDGVVSSIGFEGEQVYPSANLTVVPAPVLYHYPETERGFTASDLALTATAEGVSRSFLLIPVTPLDSPITVSFTIDGVRYESRITPGVNPFANFTSLTAGTNYKFSIIIAQGAELTINNVTVTDWEDHEVITGFEPLPD
ncbi:MAG: fimbrillin family protein [Bacteroides sp.]|nr:fimbrillin family protein [Bacteroides sp.]